MCLSRRVTIVAAAPVVSPVMMKMIILYILFLFQGNYEIIITNGFTIKPSFSPIRGSNSITTSRTSHTSKIAVTGKLITPSRTSELHAVKKRQTAIYDGAEFVSIMSFLLSENSPRISIDNDDDDAMPEARMGYMTIATGTPEESDERIIGIERFTEDGESDSDSDGDNDVDDDNNDEDDEDDDNDGDDEFISLGDGVLIYSDSAAIIPEGISDADAISTVAAALSGVHCGLPFHLMGDENEEGENERTGKVVVLGGGDYACFTAKALCELGANVTLVTTRPMGLKDTPLNPLRDTEVNTMSPIIGEDEIGFCEALGNFDTVIDTLGDEAKLGKVKTMSEGIRKSRSAGLAAKLKRDNNCDRYISTLTKSQKIVLDEGLFFARDPVLSYQKEAEKQIVPSKSNRYVIPPPRDFGSTTLQKLFDRKVIFPVDRNENGRHEKKQVFVRGCSFPDYGEYEVWPQDSRDGAAVRYGFPAIDELTLERNVEKMMGDFSPKAETKPKENKDDKSRRRRPKNPFVLDIAGISDISDEIMSPNKDCLLFISAPYCKLCKAIGPAYTRMARISKEEHESDMLFARASTGGKNGRQIAYSLQVESVPTFMLYRKGERYGEPLGVTKLPSKKLDLAIEYLMEGKEWDVEVFGDRDDNLKKQRTKLK